MKTTPHRRKLRVGELPRIYISMRRYDRNALRRDGKRGKMVHCKKLTVTIRNYTPEDARRVMREAFARDTEDKLRRLQAQVGGLHDPDAV